ncbi:hypothetical protein TNCV_4459771 [Trichonephila clavipes]|nr:hypothetical protein TNCV_4459771 [Trichonephila clavipes]
MSWPRKPDAMVANSWPSLYLSNRGEVSWCHTEDSPYIEADVRKSVEVLSLQTGVGDRGSLVVKPSGHGHELVGRHYRVTISSPDASEDLPC